MSWTPKQLEEVLKFDTDHLLSKWGFQDGEMLNEYFPGEDEEQYQFSRWVLCEVVEYYVCSQIENEIKPYRVATSHNPIRVYEVEGVHVSDLAEPPNLQPLEVSLRLVEIFETARYLSELPNSGVDMSYLRRSPRCEKLFKERGWE